MTMKTSLQAAGVSRTYVSTSGPVVALESVTVEFHGGELVVIHGPSGSGKSTLLNLLGLLDAPSSGELRLNGDRIDNLTGPALADARRDHVSFLFQDAGLIDRMNVLDNVRLPLDYRDIEEGARRDRALEAIRTVGLWDRRHVMVDTLSGGERQRVGLARVLATRSRVVICDEPTASLDEANSRMILDHLLRLAREGACVICASHDPIAIGCADRRYSLRRGHLTAGDPT
jgi:putative ABC transport system ATP-binding protein